VIRDQVCGAFNLEDINEPTFYRLPSPLNTISPHPGITMVKLYGFPLSTCTRLVALVCKEKEIPYELISVNLAQGEQNAPEFVAKQPFGQVPYIVSLF
jgi:hypothetical protein